jgi:DNA-binding MurR/RpiR family transcriptional regulator
MGIKSLSVVSHSDPSRSYAVDEIDAFELTENGDGVGNWDSPALTPLGTRFFANQAGLSSSRQRLLRQIIDESNETFFLSSREMGRRYNVDSATVIRTVQALGYERFADFAQDLREHFVTQITPYSAMKAAEQTNRSVADRVRQSLEQDLENLSALRSTLDAEKIVEIAKQINHARRIIIVGIDFAASLARSLAYALARLGVDAEAPTGSSGVVQNKVKLMTPKDLLIAISFGRGLRDTIDAVLSARRRNVPSFGITDSDITPIAKYCDIYLTASIARTSFIDSYAAPTAAINALLVACAHSQSARSLEHLRELEEENTSGVRWFQEPKGLVAKGDKKGRS